MLNRFGRLNAANLAFIIILTLGTLPVQAQDIVHDAEFYVLEAQNGEKWAAEDKGLEKRLAELRKKHGQPPNLIHIMWDDTAFGDVGIPALQKVRGLSTPNLNQLAEEGILFTRMYTEVGCTPSRAAAVTGRLAVRVGMYNIGMLLQKVMQPRSMGSGTSVISSRATLITRVLTNPSLPDTTSYCL